MELSVLHRLRRLFQNGDLDCAGVRKLSSDYMEGELSPSRLQRFRAHIAECGPCKGFVDSLMSMVRALGARGVNGTTAQAPAPAPAPV